jgi:hypothetical protein
VDTFSTTRYSQEKTTFQRVVHSPAKERLRACRQLYLPDTKERREEGSPLIRKDQRAFVFSEEERWNGGMVDLCCSAAAVRPE